MNLGDFNVSVMLEVTEEGRKRTTEKALCAIVCSTSYVTASVMR